MYNGNSCFDVLNLDIGVSHENCGETGSNTGERNTKGMCQINDEEEDDDEVSLVFTRPDLYVDSVKGLVSECEEVESINTAQEVTRNHVEGSKHKAVSARKSSNGLQKTKDSVGKPKKPATAYMVFMEDFRKKYKILYPLNRQVTRVAKAGGEKWKSMSDVDKAPHLAEARKRSKEYYENLKAYYKNLAAEKSEDDEDSCSSRFDIKREETSASEEEMEGKPNESVSDEKDNTEETEEVSDEEVSKEAYKGEGDTEEISEEDEENKDDDDNEGSKEVSIEEEDDSENKDKESDEEDDDSEDKDEESDEDDSLEEEEDDDSEDSDDESEEEGILENDTVADSEDDTYQD